MAAAAAEAEAEAEAEAKAVAVVSWKDQARRLHADRTGEECLGHRLSLGLLVRGAADRGLASSRFLVAPCACCRSGGRRSRGSKSAGAPVVDGRS